MINELQAALSLDALKSSHPISITVNNPDEIADIFDRISYSKGNKKHTFRGLNSFFLQALQFYVCYNIPYRCKSFKRALIVTF